MKKLITVCICFSVMVSISAQTPKKVQQWKDIVAKGKKDTTTLIALDSLQNWYGYNLTDSGNYYLEMLSSLAEETKNYKYIFLTLRASYEQKFILGKTADALKDAYTFVSIAEKLRDSSAISGGLAGIGNVHKEYENYEKALEYYRASLHIAKLRNKPGALIVPMLNLGFTFAQLNRLDSALYYAQQAYTSAVNNQSTLQLTAEVYLADVHYKLKNYQIAKSFYASGGTGIMNLKRDRFYGSRPVVWFNLGLANCFKQLNNIDSSINYAKKALQAAQKINYLKGLKDAEKLLAELFEKTDQTDSAFHYQKLFIIHNDSLFNRNKASAVESITLEQNKIEEEKQNTIKQQAEDRKHNIQLAFIAIGILSASIIFLLLSNSFIVSHKVVGFLSVLVLLVVFEFINLLLHPFLERITHHSPILMLLGLVAIAALIIPLHHRLEHWATHKLVEKNKAIRLAQAKKTIEELEGNKNA